MIWIWTKQNGNNTFAEFLCPFVSEGGDATLKISADFRYAAYLNGEKVSDGQYADLPFYKCVNEVSLRGALRKGENELRVIAWHLGEDCSVCRTMAAGIAFEVWQEEKLVARSDENTLCRTPARFVAGDRVSPQIGSAYHYDFTAEEEAFAPCTVAETGFCETPRPIELLQTTAPVPAEVCAQGVYFYEKNTEQETCARKMQRAFLSHRRFVEMTGKNRMQFADMHEPLRFCGENGDGLYLVVDLKRESYGLLSFALGVPKACRVFVGWGEHLSDLRVRTERDGRNFGRSFHLNAGENIFEEGLSRTGCRYLCLFAESKEIAVSRLTLREVRYPFRKPEKDFGDRLLNRIYETGRRTLELCAHEHYEDCPWREQALYGMDSRNQMLFGYGAFEEYEYPRANLRLFAQSVREDGLLHLCAPSRASITIPSFSVYFLLAVCENAAADYDGGFVREMLPVARKTLGVFFSRMTERGLTLFSEPEYWNFHEWSDGLDGGAFNRTQPLPADLDCNLTALVCRAAYEIGKLEEREGNASEAELCYERAQKLAASLENFYDERSGLYASYVRGGKKEGYHVFTQAAVLSLGHVPEARKKTMLDVLKNPAGRAVDITLAGLQMKYDALCQNGEIKACVDEIVSLFGGMLFSGATSYWETANGEADFEDAGSLCHGWSAVACYVFDRYLK